jgi:hypothetical protein
MAERSAKSQSVNLIPNHYKLGIALMHLEVCIKYYGPPKW